jgi:UDP:flavonoid glycosyltransferase YjiC (YdhE family)
LRRNILAILENPQYREASRCLAVDMADAPGFAGLADVVDNLISSPEPLPAEH